MDKGMMLIFVSEKNRPLFLAKGVHLSGVCMMTSSNGTIFRVTGPLCGEFTGPGEFPAQRPLTRSFDVFFDLRLNKRLSKQPWGWWFETLLWSLWRQCNGKSWYWIQVNPLYCHPEPCAIGPVYQPPIPENMLFYAVSGFVYTTNDLQAIYGNVIDSDGFVTPRSIMEAAMKVCQLVSHIMKQGFVTSPTLSSLWQHRL